MSDNPEFEEDHSLQDEAMDYTSVRLDKNWYLMVHPEGDIGLRYYPEGDNNPEGRTFSIDLGFTEYSAEHIKQIINVMRTGDPMGTTIH